MKKHPEKKYINTGFVIALIILIIVNIIIFIKIRFYFEEEDIINKSLNIIQNSEVLYSKIIEAETNRRGYLITGNSEFLKVYYPSISGIDSSLSILKLSFIDPEGKKVLDSLQVLIFNRKDLLQESLELQEKKSKDFKAQIEYTEHGRETVYKIKKIINRIQEKEKTKLEQKLLEADKSATYTLNNLVFGNIFAFSLLILGLVLLNRSINKKKKAELSLEENRNWLATTLESIGDAVIVTNKMGEILFINKAAENLTEWKSTETKGLLFNYVFNIYNEETGKKLPDIIQQVAACKKVVNIEDNTILITKNKNEIAIDDSAAPIINDNGDLMGVVMVFRNITERKKIEKEILNNQKFIKRIADSLPSILYIYDIQTQEFNLTYLNYKIAEILGYTSEYVLDEGSRFFKDKIHPDDLSKLRLNRYKYTKVNDNEIINYDYRIKDINGNYKWLRSYEVVFSRSENGTVKEILGSAFDITERKILEEELRKYSGHLEELVDIRTAEIKATNIKLKEEISERARAENFIIEAEEKFRSLVENALIGIYIIQDDKYIYVNPKYEDIFGYYKGEMNGRNAWDIVAPRFEMLVKENIRKRINNEIKTIQYTFKALKKDGTEIDVEVRGSTMLYNKKLSIIGTLQDITERLKAEQELRNSRQKLMLHFESTPLGVIEWDMNFRIVQWNDAAVRIFGWKQNEVLHQKADIIIPDNAKVYINEIWENLINQKGGERSTNENITKDNRIILCEWYNTPLINDEGKVIGVASLVEDITERVKAEDQIKQQKEFLRTVIDTDPNFVFAKDWEGKFTLVNKALAENYNSTPDELIGKSEADFNPGISETEHLITDDREVILTGKPKFIAEENVTNIETGENKWYQTIKVPLKGMDGKTQVLGVAADITARKLAEEMTKKSLHDKELLLKEIHHRVKNNLQIIISLLKLQSNFVYDKRDLEIFNKSRSRIETMSMIHEKLYKSDDISRINIAIYLNDLVTHLLKAYHLNSSKIDFELNTDNILMTIDTAIPCGLIVNELINNILKHAFPDGYNGKITLNLFKSGEFLHMEVLDNGIGFPENFNKESTDSLGFKLVDTLVKQLDGNIDVIKNKGTHFIIKFKEIKYKERI